VNEQIESVNKGIASIADGKMHVVCECGTLSCSETIAVDLSVYERVRSDPTLFIVRTDHVVAQIERVVEDGDDYQIVRKLPGEAEDVARATDPRA